MLVQLEEFAKSINKQVLFIQSLRPQKGIYKINRDEYIYIIANLIDIACIYYDTIDRITNNSLTDEDRKDFLIKCNLPNR